MGEPLAIVGTTGGRCDAFKQRQRLLGAAKIDFLETSEQLEALSHGTLHLRRAETFGLKLGSLM